MPKKEAAQFLNVDLDIYSKSDLTPFVAALGEKVLVLYCGHEKRSFSAHLELSRPPKTADKAIRGFVTLIRRLPRSARKLWDAAVCRTFNIAIKPGDVPACYEIGLARETVRRIAAVKGQIAVAIYGRYLKGRYIA